MEASHKTHRPHIKVGKDEEKKKSTEASMESTKMPNLRNGSKGGFELGLT